VNFSGTDEFTYLASDGLGGTAMATVVLDVMPLADPVVSVTDAGGAYNGTPFPATATLTTPGNAPVASLDGVSPTLAYYAGNLTAAQLATAAALPGAPTAAGTYTVVATFPGDTIYEPASSSPLSFTIAKATPTITWANPADITYGTALDGTQLDAAASVPGTFAYTPAAGTVLGAGSGQTLSATFTPTDTVDYNTATAAVNLTVDQAATTVAVSSSLNPSAVQQAVTFTATVTPGSGTFDDGGTVQFIVDGSNFGAPVSPRGGVATIQDAALSAGIHSITATYSGDANFTASSATLGGGQTVVGLVSLSQSTVTVSASRITAGGALLVTLTARDALGRQELGGGLTVVFGLGTGSAGGTFSAVKDHGDGTYTAIFTGIKAGSNTIKATIAAKSVSSAPPTVTITPGAVSLSQATISLSSQTAVAGGKTRVTLTARDAYGNQETNGGLKVLFSLGAGGAGGTFSAVKDHGDGTYTATFTGTTAGTDTIKATIGGQLVTSAWPTLTVTPGSVSLAQSTISLSPATVAAGGTTTATLTARDAYGNQETSGGLQILFSLGAGGAGGAFSAVKDRGNGTYTATFTGTTAGSNTINATIGGQAVSSSRPSITVTPGAVSLAQSTLTLNLATWPLAEFGPATNVKS
jgi:hypothetical protein